MKNGTTQERTASPAPRAPMGQVLVLPVAVLMEVVWATTIVFVREPAMEKFGKGIWYALGLMAIYGVLFLAVYAVIRVVLWFRMGHLESKGELRVLGFKPQSLYHRPGLEMIDGLGLVFAAILFCVALLVESMAIAAPFAAFAMIGFLSGLALGAPAPWPVRRRGRQ